MGMTYSYDAENKTYIVDGHVFCSFTEAKSYIDAEVANQPEESVAHH